MSRLHAVMRAVMEINGLTPAEPTRVAPRDASLPGPGPAPVPAKTLAARPPRPDRVLVLGGPGVLVRCRDGRLPRDGEVVPDGACLRVRCAGGPVLVAGSLREVPDACRWAPVGDLHPIDLEVLRRVAPAHAADADARDRIAALAREVARELGAQGGRGAEANLLAALDVLRARRGDPATQLAVRSDPEPEPEVSA